MIGSGDEEPNRAQPEVALVTIAREWTRLGVIGFGGPPAHIALLRRTCVEKRRWISTSEFEDAIAATNLLPGPASTQLAIFCAWRLRGVLGGFIGGLCFIAPGLILILALSGVFFAHHPPAWILGAAAGAGAAVPAVAVKAAWVLAPASWKRMGRHKSEKRRWIVYGLTGAAAAATIGAYLVVVIAAGGLIENAIRRDRPPRPKVTHRLSAVALGHLPAVGGVGAVAWVALKVGALSYGGGFVIIPLMQHDAVTTYHWMSAAEFLNAVALGQVTPGPVVQTVAAVGYAAAGVGGGLLAALVAFAPSFAFVLGGGPHFDALRKNAHIQAFLTGAGAVVIGAVAGSALPLGLAFQHLWQIPVLAGAGLWLFALHRGVVTALMAAGAVGVVITLAGVGG